MPYVSSNSPDITEGLPAALGSEALIERFEQPGRSADIAIGGLPFRLAISDQRPAQRETVPVRRQQFDASAEAGEQSLEQTFWIRSQTSWHRGRGIQFYEPGSEEGTQFRCADSQGIDIWTPGEAKLLKEMVYVVDHATYTSYVATAVVGGNDRLVYTWGDTLEVRGDSAVVTTVTVGTAATDCPLSVYGETAFVGNPASGVYSVDLSAGTATQRYTAYARPWFAKSRLFATETNKIYELNPSNSPESALPTPLYTHPISSWVWTGVAEAPAAVLVAGYAGGHSAIYKFTINEASGGGLPTLGSPIQVAEMPPGEVIHSLMVYLGAYVILGTSKGLRIGVLTADGDLQYGPLTVETTSPVYALAARDTYIWGATRNGTVYGAVRANLGEEISPLRFACANDAAWSLSSVPTSMAFLGTTDRLALTGPSGQLYLQSATNYVASGYLTSGNIRYGTTVGKAFRSAALNVQFPTSSSGASVTLSTVNATGSESSLYTYGPAAGADTDIAIPESVKGEYLAIKFAMTRSTDGLKTPTVRSATLKAVPIPTRQRLLSYPLLCFDSEEDRFGNTIGAANSGYALTRYRDLELLEESGSVITVQDFTTGEQYQAQIESIQFDRIAPPDRDLNNFGGVIRVVIRKLT